MSPDRQIVRLMAAMILAIIAYVAPSAVQAHEGHAHHGQHAAAARPKVAPPTPKAVAPPVSEATWTAVRTASPAWPGTARTSTTGDEVRIEPPRDDCCPVGCKTRCCGTMACCATAILPGRYTLSPTLFRTVTLVPRDVDGRAGIGPEAPPKPPRTLA